MTFVTIDYVETYCDFRFEIKCIQHFGTLVYPNLNIVSFRFSDRTLTVQVTKLAN